MTESRLRTLAWASLAFTLVVIVWGAFVRASGSGAGCGSHWPTCNGEVLPHPRSVEMAIELAHRVTSGLSLLLVVATFLGARRALPAGHPARAGAALALLFMMTEALVGAALVLFEHVATDRSAARAAWMSLHLVNTFLLVASMTLTASFASGAPAPRARGQAGVVALLAAGAAGLLVVGTTGAIAALGDTLFASKTLAEGLALDASPSAHFLLRLRALHPVAAVVVAAGLLGLRRPIEARRPTPAVRRAARWLGALVWAQIAAGAVNLVLLAPAAMQLVHLLLADLVWIAFVLLGGAALAPARARAASDAPAASRAAVAAL
jgi:heme A synthase